MNPPDSASQEHPSELNNDPVWHNIVAETRIEAEREPILASFLYATVLNHGTLEASLSFHLASKLDSPAAPALLLREVIEQAMGSDSTIAEAIRCDIKAYRLRDSACRSCATPLLYYKGYHALQAHRVAHWLWHQDRQALALFFQNRISINFGVDIHPAAKIGAGIMLDHATGIVIGETATIGNNVSIMQDVTLGGTGKNTGDRHPKVADGVLISAGAKILGNIIIGEGSQIGAGSVVLKKVPPHTLVAGVPAKIVGHPQCSEPALRMDHDTGAGS